MWRGDYSTYTTGTGCHHGLPAKKGRRDLRMMHVMYVYFLVYVTVYCMETLRMTSTSIAASKLYNVWVKTCPEQNELTPNRFLCRVSFLATLCPAISKEFSAYHVGIIICSGGFLLPFLFRLVALVGPLNVSFV